MNAQRQMTAKGSTAAPAASFPARSGVLQRKCACGGLAGPTGECAECRRELQLCGTLQAKLHVGRSDDPLEREADRVADAVMRLPAPDPMAAGKQAAREELSTKPPAGRITPMAQRLADETTHAQEEEEEPTAAGGAGRIQAKERDAGALAVPKSAASPIQALRGGGQPLPTSERAFSEPRFGQDFASVRIHTDSRAQAIAKSINARAFTLGRDIAFGSGQYSPGTPSGRRLIAHELAHVVQQGNGRKMASATASGVIRRQGGPPPPAPTRIDFSSADPVHVPACGRFSARTNVRGVTWSLLPNPTAIARGTTIDARGRITIAAAQAAGQINVRATNSAGAWFERALRIRSHPTGITNTANIGLAGALLYGGTFDHVFSSNDGNVASLQQVGVGERFAGVPNPTAAVHLIRAPTWPFGGTFRLQTATLTPNATNNWFLTAAGGLNGTQDNVTTGRANINVARFVPSASNPRPRYRLPADMTLTQGLYWYCPQRPAARRWQRFVNVAHSRTLRTSGGNVHFVTTVNGLELIETYHQPIAVHNATAAPVSTPRSAPAPAAQRTVRITVDTLPTNLPPGQPLRFSFVGNRRGCAVAPDPANNHAGILTIGRQAGSVRVQISDHTGRHFDRVTITVT